MQKSKRTDDGWTVDDAPYFASEFDAARAMSVMTDEPTFVLPFHGVEDFPPESAPLAVKSAQATLNGLIDPVMFGPTEHQWNNRGVMDYWRRGLPKNRRRLLFRGSALGEQQG